MSAISTKPYLLRALYEWCLDSGYTPYITAWVNEHTQVPSQYVNENQIILNISVSACQNLNIDNEWIHFLARFSGVAHDIWIPVDHIANIFAKETGEGMAFDITPYQPAHPPLDQSTKDLASESSSNQHKGLKLIK